MSTAAAQIMNQLEDEKNEVAMVLTQLHKK